MPLTFSFLFKTTLADYVPVPTSEVTIECEHTFKLVIISWKFGKTTCRCCLSQVYCVYNFLLLLINLVYLVGITR